MWQQKTNTPSLCIFFPFVASGFILDFLPLTYLSDYNLLLSYVQ